MKSEAKSKTQPSSDSAPRGAAPGLAAASSLLSQEDLKVLKAPFPKESLGVKVQSVSKDRTRALLVLYLQHTNVQDRLEQVDPAWSTEVLAEERQGDTVYVRLRMTVKGVSRENVGEGGDPKGAYSDALKRCAMLFGVGRYLYDSPLVWVDYNESRDRFRQWSIQDYEKPAKSRFAAPGEAGQTPALPLERESAPAAAPPRSSARSNPSPGLTTQPVAASGSGKKAVRSREQLNRILMNLYRPYLTKFPETRFVELLQARYNVGETRLMTLEQIEDLVQFMEQQLESAA